MCGIFVGMQVVNLYEPFEVELMEGMSCPMGAHKHNFFELVYIISGNGVQCINKNQLPYQEEALFLLMPQDCHSFRVSSLTKFFFVRFNDIYLKSQSKEWIRQLEFIFQNNNHLPGCILRNKADKPLVRSLVEALVREFNDPQPYQREVASQMVNTLLALVARNIAMMHPAATQLQHQDAMHALLAYIHQHIYSPELLKAEQLAAQFNISPTYISEYFKKLTGETMQQYITNYKLRLVETRLLYSDLRVNEIAWELNFTDESHLNRMFKKYKGLTPSEFRRQGKAAVN